MLSLHPYDEQESFDDGPWAPLPEQLQVYLHVIDGFPHLARLAECDFYTDTRFSLDATRAMAEELAQLTEAVHARAVPPPPDYIALNPGETAG